MSKQTSGDKRFPSSGPAVAQHNHRSVARTRPDLSKQSGGGGLTYSIGGEKCDAVSFNMILADRINQEWAAVKKWEDNYSFMVEYDSKGNRRPAKVLPEKETIFNNPKVPVTVGASYGSRQNSEAAKAIMKYQFNMGKGFRRISHGPEFQSY